MAIQDKFAVGPVTLVQLVGLAASPRIPSAHADGAARAADAPPQSAAAGLGSAPQQPVSDIVSAYFGLKVAPSLDLSADPLRAHITFDAGVDRAAPSATKPAASIDPANFHHVSTDTTAADPAIDSGTESHVPKARDGSLDALSENTVASSTSDTRAAPAEPVSGDAPVPDVGARMSELAMKDHYVFDGETAFGDDKILDFTLAASDAYIAASTAPEHGGASDGFDYSLALHGVSLGDFGVADVIDLSAEHASEPQPAVESAHFADPLHLAPASDAVPVI